MTAHDGVGVTENLVKVTDQYIKSEQYRGGSFDGQYFHQKVHTKLDEHYAAKGFHTIDPMHRAGTVDIHLRKEKRFQWLVEMTVLVGQAFKVVNYGKEFQHFFEVVQALIELEYDVKFKFPRFYSETKFANYVRLVYMNFRETFPGLVRTFEESQARLNKGDSENRKKAKTISDIQGKIMSLKVNLHLSGSCDVYERFGHEINILQTVNMLPHTKYDNFVEIAVNGLKTMSETVDPADCSCQGKFESTNCLWKILHKDLKDINEHNQYRGVPVGRLMADELHTRQGRRREQENLLLDKKGLVKKCLKQLSELADEMSKKLLKDVFDEATKEVINCVRNVLDLETLARQVKMCGSPHVAALGSVQFIESARKIVSDLSEISDQELRLQFNTFLSRLEDYVEDIDEDNLNSLKIFKDFLDTKLSLYKGIEMIIHEFWRHLNEC